MTFHNYDFVGGDGIINLCIKLCILYEFYNGEPFRIQVLSFYDEEPFRIQVLSLTDWKSQRLEENQQDYNTHSTIEC